MNVPVACLAFLGVQTLLGLFMQAVGVPMEARLFAVGFASGCFTMWLGHDITRTKCTHANCEQCRKGEPCQ